jgi:FAD/FMN-containing dehydrogenase
VHCGSLADGEKSLAPIKAFGSPVMNMIGPIPYTVQNTLLDPSFPRGALNYWKASFLTDLSDAAIAALLESFAACPSPMSQIVVEHFHGKASRVGVTDTACAMRLSGFNVVLISQWTDPSQNDTHIAWCRNTYAALQPYLAQTRYVNYLATDEDAAAAAAYGPNYARLQELKTKYDPDNFFHANVNIRPR